MGTKTIGLKEDAYERLKARKREDESFTDLVERLLEETTTDWREGFGTLPDAKADQLEQLTAASRKQTSDGLAKRQQDAVEAFAAVTDSDEETARDDETA